ncbi:RING finger protein, putative [Paecilomyces variotii No. 5]|uniref:RING finger protein, putative n=1 Tax=Byssochlamys spectabilis (strain No. 5 / NBRC 109023) TaxID=1356009 RepID=V5HQZ7_BYSSN|nr:RING finger protein, putative [Paecilomyces variotii No. 5]
MMHEVIEILSDGESGPLETSGVLRSNTITTGANHNTRGASFTHYFTPDSHRPAQKKRKLAQGSALQTADMFFTTSKSSSTRSKQPASSETSFWPFSQHESSLLETDETACLKLVVELFPDISRTYIRELYQKYKYSGYSEGSITTSSSKGKRKAAEVDPSVIVQRITEDVLANPSYPKHKSKRDATGDDAEAVWREEFLSHEHEGAYIHSIMYILVEAFPWVPLEYIQPLVRRKKSLYSAYLSLYASENYDGKKQTPPYRRLPTARGTPSEATLMESHAKRPQWGFRNQVNSAKSRLIKENGIFDSPAHLRYVTDKLCIADELQRKKVAERAEKLNEEEHRKAGALIECQCCFADVPSNRAIPCEGEDDVHFFCYGCVKNGAESQIGQMKYEMKCFDISGCKARFSRSKLTEAVGSAIIAKLEALEQQAEIARANIEGLEECPFCNFKAILPPVAEDREFRCHNPDCKKVSCRLCDFESHLPKTCQEAKKDRGLQGRHFVEEAMSDALIRTCNSCGVKLIKEYGCNKMTCPCGSLMCYLCKKDITIEKYNHFIDVTPNGVFMPNTRSRPRGCIMNDEAPAERDRAEVEGAERAAIRKMRSQNPHLKEEDLRVDKEEQRTSARRRATYPVNNIIRPQEAPRMVPWPGPQPQLQPQPMVVGPVPVIQYPYGMPWHLTMQAGVPPMPPAGGVWGAPGIYGPPPVRRNLNVMPLGGRPIREPRPDTPRLPNFNDGQADAVAPNRPGGRRGRR